MPFPLNTDWNCVNTICTEVTKRRFCSILGMGKVIDMELSGLQLINCTCECNCDLTWIKTVTDCNCASLWFRLWLLLTVTVTACNSDYFLETWLGILNKIKIPYVQNQNTKYRTTFGNFERHIKQNQTTVWILVVKRAYQHICAED